MKVDGSRRPGPEPRAASRGNHSQNVPFGPERTWFAPWGGSGRRDGLRFRRGQTRGSVLGCLDNVGWGSRSSLGCISRAFQGSLRRELRSCSRASSFMRVVVWVDVRSRPVRPRSACSSAVMYARASSSSRWMRASSALIHTEGAGIVAMRSRMASAERVQVKGRGASLCSAR